MLKDIKIPKGMVKKTLMNTTEYRSYLTDYNFVETLHRDETIKIFVGAPVWPTKSYH